MSKKIATREAYGKALAGLANTNENIVDCPMDVEAAVMKADCPTNNNPNNEDKMCNYPGCNHKRHKKSNPEGRCKCHERLELPTS